MIRETARTLLLPALALCAGCSSDGINPIAGLPAAGELGASTIASVSSILPSGDKIVGTPTDVYTRIAHGVLTCWFGAAGPLKMTHIYHANAEPPSKGGRSEIEIFLKDLSAPDPRALRAYRIEIFSQDNRTKVEVENVKIPEPLATQLGGDVERWSADEGGCGNAPVTGGWAAGQVTTEKAQGAASRSSATQRPAASKKPP